jgi:hypothetical protein
MKLAWTLHVTAGVTVKSGAMAPSRASADKRGVKVPRWRGVSPTTMIAKTGFKFPSLKTSNIFADFVSALILAVFPNPATGLPTVQTKWHLVAWEMLPEGPPTLRARYRFCVKELAG